MTISSDAFSNGQEIPVQNTADGENISPSLYFDSPPFGTKSLTLVMKDADSENNWIHWLVYNIPPETTNVAEGEIPTGGTQGLANGGTYGYEGPNQQYFSGIHYYVFTLYALDTVLDVSKSSTWQDIEGEVTAHSLDTAELVGTQKGRMQS